MPDAAVLREAWARASGSTAAKLAAVNKLTTVGRPVDLPVAAIAEYLGDKREQLQDYAAMLVTSELRAKLGMAPVSPGVAAASHLLLLLDGADGPTLRTSQPHVLAVFRNLLDAIVADSSSGITEADRDGLLALVRPQVPLFAPPVSVLDLAAAKLS
jgi:hypothetical protein